MNESEESRKIIADSKNRPEVSALMKNANPDLESSSTQVFQVMGDMMKNLKIEGVDDADFDLIHKAEEELKSVNSDEWRMLNWPQSRKPSKDSFPNKS